MAAHRIAISETAPLDISTLPDPSAIRALLPEAPTRLSYERDAAGHARAVAEFALRAPMLIDLETTRVISPLSADAAAEVARAHVAGRPAVRDRRLVSTATPEYRGALPAWRIALDDREGLVVYVAANTARVTARRSDL